MMTTPAIDLRPAARGPLLLAFDSSWVPDEPMVARVFAEFDRGGRVPVLEWSSIQGSATYKAAGSSERVRIPIDPPARARSVRLVFQLGESNNDWYWALDDVRLLGPAPR